MPQVVHCSLVDSEGEIAELDQLCVQTYDCIDGSDRTVASLRGTGEFALLGFDAGFHLGGEKCDDG